MKNLRILAYHRILSETRGMLSVRTTDFDRHIRFFIKNGWECLTLEKLNDQYLKRDHNLDKKIFVITFDDGYRDNYKNAFSILKQYGIKATIFLTVDYIGKHEPFYWDRRRFSEFIEYDYPLNWNEIHEMKDYGIEFGSHTLTHPELTDIELNDAQEQICDSKTILDRQLSQDTISFCYPKGSLNHEICQLVRQAGYQLAVVTPSIYGIKESNFTLKRIGLYSTDSFFSFRLKNSILFSVLRETKLWHILKR